MLRHGPFIVITDATGHYAIGCILFLGDEYIIYNKMTNKVLFL